MPASAAQKMYPLDADTQFFICNGIVEGRPIKELCDKLGISINHYYWAASIDPQFDKNIQRARVYWAHQLVDELMHCTANKSTIAEANLARVWSDNAKWVASKMNPSKYGDNLNINVTHLDLSSVLLAAENRVMSVIEAKGNVVPHAEVALEDRSSVVEDSGASLSSSLEGLGDIPAELEDLI